MEDAADGAVDMDDEDPDMDDWGEMYSDNDEAREHEVDRDANGESESDDDEIDAINEGEENDIKLHNEDDFMDAVESDSSVSAVLKDGFSAKEDGFCVVQKSSEEWSSDDGNDLIFANDDNDDDDGVDDRSEETPRSRKKAKKIASLPTFADAGEYEALINNDFEKLIKKKENESISPQKRRKSSS